MKKFLFISMLPSVFLIGHADDTPIRVSACEIVGTKPVQGGEKCYFHSGYVLVDRCVGNPCRLTNNLVKENSRFKCPDSNQPPVPRWTTAQKLSQSLAVMARGLGEVIPASEAPTYFASKRNNSKLPTIVFTSATDWKSALGNFTEKTNSTNPKEVGRIILSDTLNNSFAAAHVYEGKEYKKIDFFEVFDNCSTTH